MKLTKALLGICTALTVATAAHAKHIVLESQPLDKALTSLSIKTGAKVYWKAADVQNITIERTEGDDTKLKELLASMLSGTGLKATISADGQSVFIAKGNFMVGDVADKWQSDTTNTTRSRNVNPRVPIYIIYRTLYKCPDGQWQTFPDVYGYDEIIYRRIKPFLR